MVLILALLTFVIFILIGIALEHWAKRRSEEQPDVRSRPEVKIMDESTLPSPAPAGFKNISVPGGVFFHPGHTWAYLEFSGVARVGMDDFARKAIGRIDRIEPVPRGSSIRQGENLVTITQGQRRIDLVSPVDGVINSVNEEVLANPERLKEDPYRAGWLLEIRPVDLLDNLRRLKIASEASLWIEKELKKFSEFMANTMRKPEEVGVTVPDGGDYITGIVTSGIVEKMDDHQFKVFTRTFFDER